MREDERRAAVSKISRAAKEEMKRWKAEMGITAIVKRTENQKLETKRYLKDARRRERAEMKKVSTGAASAVRFIKPEGE